MGYEVRTMCSMYCDVSAIEVGGQAVLGRQDASPTPWLTERHGYDPTWDSVVDVGMMENYSV